MGMAFLVGVAFGWVLGIATMVALDRWHRARRKKRIQRVIQSLPPERREATLARLHVQIEQAHERIEHELNQL